MPHWYIRHASQLESKPVRQPEDELNITTNEGRRLVREFTLLPDDLGVARWLFRCERWQAVAPGDVARGDGLIGGDGVV